MNTIIIEDNPDVFNLIKTLVNEHHSLNYVGTSDNVQQGISLINDIKPDLVLLDIELKDGTSFDILNALDSINFKIIFITDFENYALKAFQFNAIDYVLKPFSEDDFNDAINKVLKQNKLEHQELQITSLLNDLKFPDKKQEKLVLNSSGDINVVSIEDIVRCESDNNYTFFHLIDGKKIFISKQLKDFESLLKNNSFIRVHKSHLINLFHIRKVDKKKNEIVLGKDTIIPISIRKKENLIEALKQFKSL